MSTELTSEDFQTVLDEYWHDRSPTSLEDVMALYGVLAVAESGSGLFTTPSKLSPFIDDGRLVTISVDLTGETPAVRDIDQRVPREEDIPKLGYSHKSSGRGAKYSLTQIGSKNGNDADGVASTILGRVRSWTGQEPVQGLTGDEGHPDGWIIEELANVFEKDSETMEQLKSDIRSLLPADDSIPTVMTVRLKVEGEEIESIDTDEVTWVWPGDVGLLEEAMRRYASANAADKNIDNGSSEGEAIGLVNDELDRVVGTPESPLGVFSVKHPDAQPGLRREQSWRNYPVTADTAQLFAKSQDLIERCVYRRGGMETYALPYFAGEMTGLKAEALYLAIESIQSESDYLDSGDPPMAQVTFNLQEHENEEIRQLAERELRFYTVTMPISDDKHIISETPAAQTYWITELADALVDTLNGPSLTPTQGGFMSYDGWPLLDVPTDLSAGRTHAFYLITGHEFTDAVFGYRGDEEGDDFRRVVDHRLISGQPLSAKMLFEEYLRRYRDGSEDGETPPHQLVVQQLVHLETLSRAGLLEGISTPIEPSNTTMTTEIDTSDITTIREQRLDKFLDRPLFEGSERSATALAGVLIGQVSWHQESVRGIGRPLDTTTRGDELTKNNLENAITSALEKAKVYAEDSDRSFERDVLFPETVDRLLEETEAMPTSWDIDKREMQFCYVLGHAHGRRSMPVAFDLLEDDESAQDETATEEHSAD